MKGEKQKIENYFQKGVHFEHFETKRFFNFDRKYLAKILYNE